MARDSVSYLWRSGCLETISAETQLIERAKQQDESAFAQIVNLYADKLYNYIVRMLGNPHDAEDVLQEVFLRAYQGLPSFDGRASLSTWLFRIAHNLCIDHYRKQERRVKTVSIYQDNPDEADEGAEEWEFPDTQTPDPMQAVLDRELQEVVERALESLSPKLKSVLLLYDMEGLSYEEISQSLGIPMGTVKSRLHLARSEIQKKVAAYLRGETV
ncbi:MAG: sigma-70 family RNA polymerase sigma factor [Armatimonadetes bacterium]|nr:sigma-70 family RNA polymerase sigma factor [Armatimonadota bacterium]